jgi:hypothetical protein
VEEGEMKMDKKIDMLYRAGLIGTGSHAEAPDVEDEDEGAEEVDLDNVEASLVSPRRRHDLRDSSFTLFW